MRINSQRVNNGPLNPQSQSTFKPPEGCNLFASGLSHFDQRTPPQPQYITKSKSYAHILKWLQKECRFCWCPLYVRTVWLTSVHSKLYDHKNDVIVFILWDLQVRKCSEVVPNFILRKKDIFSWTWQWIIALPLKVELLNSK